MVPTPKGLAHALDLAEPAGDDAVPALAATGRRSPARHVQQPDWAMREGAWSRAANAGQAALAVGPAADRADRHPRTAERWLFSRLPEWEETPKRPAAKPDRADRRCVSTRG
jgi:ATP-dependent DNA helicase DinG